MVRERRAEEEKKREREGKRILHLMRRRKEEISEVKLDFLRNCFSLQISCKNFIVLWTFPWQHLSYAAAAAGDKQTDGQTDRG